MQEPEEIIWLLQSPTCKPVNKYEASLLIIFLNVQAQQMYINKGDGGFTPFGPTYPYEYGIHILLVI